MSINITDDLLKSIQQELLSSLQRVEGQLVDLLEFDDRQEVDEILETLHLAESTLVMLSEKTAATFCHHLYHQINLFSEGRDNQIERDKLSFDFLALIRAIGVLDSELSEVSLEHAYLDTDRLFPVEQETIEKVAFSMKKDISIIKNLLENNIHHLDNQSVVENLSEVLNQLFAVFKLVNHYTGISLTNRLISLLKNHSVKENIEEFTDNLILLEDALWQLDSLQTVSQDSSKISQVQHSRQMVIETAKVTLAKTAHLLFKQLRKNIVENFEHLERLDMMRLAESFHKVATGVTFFQEYQLAELLRDSEQQHLFFCHEKTAIKQPNVNQYYLDVILTYEIVFAQLQKSSDVSQYALSVETAQQQLLSQIDFSTEKMATPDYYYDSNSNLSGDVEDELLGIADHVKAISDAGISVTEEITDIDQTILEAFLAEAKIINQTNQECLANWKDNDSNLATIQKFQRGIHTLKGGARMVGLNILGDLSEYVEILLAYLVNGDIKNQSVARQLLEEENNISTEIIRLADNHQVINDQTHYIEKLSSFIETETGKPLGNIQLRKPEKVAGFSTVNHGTYDQPNNALNDVRFDFIDKRMNRLVQQLSKELDKPIRLEIQGGDIEINHHLLEKLIPGFEHAVRNAIVHGIETISEREEKGKAAIGCIHLGAYRHGTELLFTIADDGQGADLNVIREKAKILGILDEQKANNSHYLLTLLFNSGFSTANEVTPFCGRGIGLDVLKESVKEINGKIEIDSQVDKGLMICIRVIQ